MAVRGRPRPWPLGFVGIFTGWFRVKPRLLDLFCGAGGCTKGYQDAGFYVVGVDISAQPNYCGDEFHLSDVLLLQPWVLDHLRAKAAA